MPQTRSHPESWRATRYVARHHESVDPGSFAVFAAVGDELQSAHHPGGNQ